MRYVISTVCRRYGLTSRTLRRREAEGLIHSIRDLYRPSAPRGYDDEALAHIEKITVLKKIDLPLAVIRQVLDGEVSLPTVLLDHRARLCAEITATESRIHLLRQAIACVDEGRDLFSDRQNRIERKIIKTFFRNPLAFLDKLWYNISCCTGV